MQTSRIDPWLIQKDLEETYDLIRQWGVVHSQEFTWRPDLHSEITVRSAKYPTAEAASQDAREQALYFGYKAPKWWQFWRWGEHPLPNQE